MLSLRLIRHGCANHCTRVAWSQSNCWTRISSTTLARGYSTNEKSSNAGRWRCSVNNSPGFLTPRSCLHTPVSSRAWLSQPPPPLSHPEKGDLIYVGNLASFVKIVKAFSVSTSIMGLAFQPFIYNGLSELPPFLAVACGGFIGFFVFLTPLLLHFVTKRYVTAIYFRRDTKEFTATTFTFLVNERDTKFVAGDVKLLDIPMLFTTLKVSGKPLFIDQEQFTNIEAGKHLLGYDKPVDWGIPPTDSIVDDHSKEKNKP